MFLTAVYIYVFQDSKLIKKQVDQRVSAMFLHPHYNVLPKSHDHDTTDHNIPLSLGI